ncbi:uncharacterized protein NECHADRAFT_51785 [Fusarium vanettenii 77-13-4]|uniref:Manganese lipoxygenase n=1 Tax=Fusarium vanettenii (strain ATCC MYA-4622 / CBS 123669 / FGSC 9596 / NRRL 45880 / 77-13-4) TaxID=660122 RepID=C7ZH98_FUSV7|nr:uncharacterized protein NECHADRAFT_51785 [Fusarium vanettenii 77-13-4]EEU36715.1 hypothetical protein NECHADRAFT_51785 [Fusarium vanettenii 77-13-4]
MSAAVHKPLPPRSQLDKILKGKVRNDVEKEDLQVFDKGVFMNELLRIGIALETTKQGVLKGGLVASEGIKKGTFKGTQLAMTEMYKIIEEAAAAHYDARGFEPIFPVERDLTTKQQIYQWTDGSDGYPPHLKDLPDDEKDDQTNNPEEQPRSEGVGKIFDYNKTQFVRNIAKAVGFLIPKEIEAEGTPYAGPTLADCEQWNRDHQSPATDIMKGRNIGEHKDWYSDARFAQQHLSGVNPSTIETAPKDKIQEYIAQAEKQGLGGIKKILSSDKDILIQDYSYFRKATGLKDEENFINVVPILNEQNAPIGKAERYACAPIVIFQLHEDGRLHPLAITIDYKGSLDKSVTIFNKRLTPDDKDVDEKEDWPWRYAKTCAQTADWARHEIATHLVDTHMVEEAIIVATNRTIPEGHLLYEILSPHWFRTLALNSAARTLLVPAVIARISGFGPTWNPVDPDKSKYRTFKLVDYSYKNFNFVDKYIPNDLKKRGFNIEKEKYEKYRNYPYAYDMYLLWGVIREFVQSVLETKYKCDADVQNDKYILPWCKEIQSKDGGQVTSFPTIKTVDELIDAVTMCIHIASPQHTAVNYLQDYYYSFVPAKPPALCTALPTDLKTLQGYKEAELTKALPIGTEGPKWKDWLLAAQLPELLSFKVDDRYNLLTYAKSLYNVNKARNIGDNPEFNAAAIKDAAKTLYSRLNDLSEIFQIISLAQTKGNVEYPVLEPSTTAISILI